MTSHRPSRRVFQCVPQKLGLLEQLEDRCVPAVFTVNTISDAIAAGAPGDDLLSIREALEIINGGGLDFGDLAPDEQAQIQTTPDAIGVNDTIEFDASLDGLTIDLNNGVLEILNDVVINATANGVTSLTLDGLGTSNIFVLDNGSPTLLVAELRGLSMVNGQGNLGGGIVVGAISNAENLTLIDSSITGGIVQIGGGISNAGMLTLDNTTITGNYASTRAGGIYNATGGNVLITNGSMISNNRSRDDGGGLFNQGMLTIEQSSAITGNQADTLLGGGNHDGVGQGGGIYNDDGNVFINGSSVTGNYAVYGGGIYSRTTSSNQVRIDNSTLGNNYALVHGGGILNQGMLTIQNNSLLSNNYADTQVDGTPDNGVGDGGGIWSQSGTLSISNSTLSGNFGVLGGGVYLYSGILNIQNNSQVTSNNAEYGGGVYNAGANVTINDSTISGNQASFNGGGVYNTASGILTIQNNANVLDNLANGYGGGVYNQGMLYIQSGSTFTGNRADNDDDNSGDGGGLFNDEGTVLIDNATIGVVGMENHAANGGGVGTNGGSVTIQNNSRLDGNDATAYGGGLNAFGNSTVTITNSTVVGNTASREAGLSFLTGIHTLTNVLIDSNQSDNTGGGVSSSLNAEVSIDQSTITNNTATTGGGLYIGTNATLNLSNTTLSGNQASGNGAGAYVASTGTLEIVGSTLGGLDPLDANVANLAGGGIFNAGSTIVRQSLLTGNFAGTGGGGIYSTGDLTVLNSTLSGNAANEAGGAIDVENGTLTLIHVTITNNLSDADASGVGPGGGVAFNGTVFQIANSIVAGNFDNTGTANDVSNVVPLVSNGFNLVGDPAGTTGFDLAETGFDVADLLLPLADNGGPTLTHALLESSAGVDAGNNANAVDHLGNPLDTDQRGGTFQRLVNSTVDIGAFEFGAVPDPVLPGSVLSSEVGESTFAAFLVTITGSMVELDDLEIMGGVARQLTDNGDGTFSVIIAPHTVGIVTVAIPSLGPDAITTVFSSLSFGSSNDEFVRNLYTLIFARTPLDSEVEFWTMQMTNGATRPDVLAGFLASDEFSTLFDNNAELVDGIYQTLFGRDADTNFWTNLLNGGAGLDEVLQGIFSSREYLTRVVHETYNEFLRRPSDDVGHAFWVDALLAGNLTIDQLRLQFQNSSESQMAS